ncbi:hypothetical protein [Tardiphaga sp.]|uniref:hypothetical protein n=1 Tax=Tardiphaga sp. TaxID=1926292 RepID=UPI00262C6D5F|nr:hypothetical protein [Tardiphaga sp.]MDB5615953.1 hypothetical protein [Tardiphaga sp.]
MSGYVEWLFWLIVGFATAHLMPTLVFVLQFGFKAVAPLLTEAIQDSVLRFLAKLKTKVGTGSGLGGEWHSVWYADSKNWPHENVCRVTLRSMGNRALGIYEYKGKRWKVTASLGKDNIVSGTWNEINSSGYRGTWIGKLSLKGENITALYLGNSDQAPNFGAGEWTWWRVGTSKPNFPVPLVQLATRETL